MKGQDAKDHRKLWGTVCIICGVVLGLFAILRACTEGTA